MIIQGVKNSDRWHDLIMLGVIFFMSIVYLTLSGRHPYNFDEFQVLYASASLVRGKALYLDQIGGHFPFFNIVISFLIRILGFKAEVLLIGRYFIILVNMTVLFYVYRTGEILWGKRTGMTAVVLILSCYVFMSTGVEIRHDVFNMAFNVIGAYYGIRYLKEDRLTFVFISGIFLGLAFASTQKAIVWVLAIFIGMLLCVFRWKSIRKLLKISFSYLIVIPIPLILSMFYLVIANNEKMIQFFHRSVIKVIIAFAPFTNEPFPFPHNRYDKFLELIYHNHLLYVLAIVGIIATVVLWYNTNSHRMVIAVWALIGIAFYITAKRPFFQTFLPSIPPLCILTAGLLSDLSKDFKKSAFHKKAAIGIVLLGLLLVWPLYTARSSLSPNHSRINISKLANISFCLENLTEGERVLCFTQNQIFFDPIMKVSDDECGERFYDYDADCFELKMRDKQCKIVINDYRTGLLGQAVLKKISSNYLPVNIGDILIPGFRIATQEKIYKEVWIKGTYYSPTLALELNGEKINGNLIDLSQGLISFKNLSGRPVNLIYMFKPETISDKLQDMET